ncbi:alpha/beta hydrolase [Hyphobacterium sp. CCMP332]|nr:alpha/beta hydrolase [Hyphobacterium sp. CCMP332]
MEKTHEFSLKANYYQIGKPKDPERIWLVCHGYGQLASRFIKKFIALDQNKNLIIAPEGLSHFYLDGLSGNVGASWMTKHNRELEIENQFSFLESLMISKVKASKAKRISLLGFSQGGATICRWISKSEIIFDDLYLWATIFPPDMSTDFLDKTLLGKNVRIFYGDKDPFLKNEHIQKTKQLMDRVPQLKIVKFEGDHRVIPEVLIKHMD